MSSQHIDKLATGYCLSFLEQIKYAIRSMPYGDVMKMAKGISFSKTHDTERLARTQARALWEWAHGDKTKAEQTTEERTRLPRGGESLFIE